MRELKDVIHYYLPYGVEMKYYNEYLTPQIRELTPKNIDWYSSKPYKARPLLRPLSDLTKEIAKWLVETKGEEFNANYEDCVSWYELQREDIDNMPFDMAQKILSLHGDLFNLIESDQAIKK